MIQKKWFRVETGKDGSVLSCTEVEARGRTGAVVRFYEAADEADACSQAKAWYELYKTRARGKVSARKARLISEGVCWRRMKGCLIETKPGSNCCINCISASSSAREARRLAVKNGSVVTRNQSDPAKVMKNVLDNSRRGQERLRREAGGPMAYIYLRILRRLDRDGAVLLREWLVSRIPSMRNGWHPPLVIEPLAQAAE